MARKPRIEFPGALYHVITRGNNKRAIFRDNKDRERLLTQFVRCNRRYPFNLYSFVLMPNHVHLLIEMDQSPLSRIMQQLLGGYAQYFNRRHHQVGHLFQGRYKAILCEKDSYLLELVRYIHLNPVRSGLVQDPSDYLWSSHRTYLGQEKLVFVDTSPVLKMMGIEITKARKAFSRFVYDGLGIGHREDLYETVEQRYLGSETFVERIRGRVEKGVQRGKGLQQKIHLGELLRVVCQRVGVSVNEVLSKSRKEATVLARAILSYIAREYGGQSVSEVGEFLKRDASVVSRLIDKVQTKLPMDKTLRKLLGTVLRGLRK